MSGCGQSDAMLLASCRRMSSSPPSVSAWEPIMRMKPCPVVVVGVPSCAPKRTTPCVVPLVPAPRATMRCA
eukprot:12489972-Heterocapsa_arctica.AAC.1